MDYAMTEYVKNKKAFRQGFSETFLREKYPSEPFDARASFERASRNKFPSLLHIQNFHSFKVADEVWWEARVIVSELEQVRE